MGQGTEMLSQCLSRLWREPVEKSGLLKYCLEKLDRPDITSESLVELLRAIGNGVADRDTSRDIALPYLSKIIEKLNNSDVAISVLYNIGLDYEQGQKEFAAKRLDRTILQYLVPDSGSRSRKLTQGTPAASQALEILAWTADKLQPDVLPDSEECIQKLLHLIHQCESWDDFRNLSAASSYLQDREIQKQCTKQHTLSRILEIIPKAGQLASLDERNEDYDEEDRKEMAEELQMVTNLILHEVSNITSLDEFSEQYTLQDPLVQQQCEWLRSSSTAKQTCACIILGNLAIVDDVCIQMVQEYKLHIPLIAMINNNSDRSVLYLAAGFFRHLSQPRENSSVLSSAHATPAAMSLLSQKSPELDFEAAAILRRLVNDSYSSSQTLIAGDGYVQSLLLTTHASKTAIEVGRLIVALFRTLSKEAKSQKETVEELWARLLEHEELTKPLTLMVQQDQMETLKAEGWLGFGLMARSGKEGAQKAVDAFVSEDRFELLGRAALEGDEKGAEKGNALALVSLMLPNAVNTVMEGKLQSLLEEGISTTQKAEEIK
ncbi:hypothetical protein K490DRAFT_66564 [Saccharata proteae CBS 121410]|uniref:ARM repeat-containing protein n=1 Tax=Saccharata proteae CBS 121410 TaxID=1314787 RepID=A0A9P4HUK9_9PEZI|nr:hypothetical protein K490DRAFT_66564 [Saccharata proteae CBS 121410]